LKHVVNYHRHQESCDPDSPLAQHAAAKASLRLKRNCFSFVAFSAVLSLTLVIGAPSHLGTSLSLESKNPGVHFGQPKESLKGAYDRAVSEKKTEFLRVTSLIRVDGETLRIREEYLLAAFGNEMDHGFYRNWLTQEPIPVPNGGTAPGPTLTYQFESARRWWLPAQLLEKWEPLVDSNELLPIPPPVAFSTTSETDPNGGRSALKLGSESAPLERGLYIYRIDYQVQGAIHHEKRFATTGFMFSTLASHGAPIRTFQASVQFRETPNRMSLIPLVIEERSREGDLSGGYRKDVSGVRPSANSSSATISAIDGAMGVQLMVGWTMEPQEDL